MSSTDDVRVWLLLSFGDDRNYAGNRGYDEDPRTVYRYDSFVQNHKQLRAGDFVVVRNHDDMLGIGRVDRIDEREGTKVRYSCPMAGCGSSALKLRKQKRPPYFCSKCKSAFENPVASEVPCTLYTAHFGADFVDTPDAVSIEELRGACLVYNGQLAMQRMDPLPIMPRLLADHPLVRNLIEKGRYLDAGQGEPDRQGDSQYVPEHLDERELALASIRLRRGQHQFRAELLRRFEGRCAVTGCAVVDILEAAHIAPYRGVVDNDPSNGLLLRADIHTLFDLDFLGIHPQTLIVHVHETIRGTEYEEFDGVVVAACTFVLSQSALETRWRRFLMR